MKISGALMEALVDLLRGRQLSLAEPPLTLGQLAVLALLPLVVGEHPSHQGDAQADEGKLQVAHVPPFPPPPSRGRG